LKISPFEALYDKTCDTLVSWDSPAYKVVLGPKLLREMEEQMVKIKKKLKATHDRRKIVM